MKPPVGAAVTVLAAACLMSVGMSGCTSLCSSTELSAVPVRVDDPTAPLSLRARLTRDGEPFPGQHVAFFSSSTDSQGRPAGSSLGKGETDSDGVATITVRGGTEGITLPSEDLTGYRAKFAPVVEIEGTQYCKSEAHGAFE